MKELKASAGGSSRRKGTFSPSLSSPLPLVGRGKGESDSPTELELGSRGDALARGDGEGTAGEGGERKAWKRGGGTAGTGSPVQHRLDPSPHLVRGLRTGFWPAWLLGEGRESQREGKM